MSKAIMGIDPGISNGGIVLHLGDEFHCWKMPRKAQEVYAIFQDAMTYAGEREIIAFVEKVSSFHGDTKIKGKRFGIDKLLANYTTLKNMLEILEIPYHEVMPRSWQSTLKMNKGFKGESRDDRKRRYRDFVAGKIKQDLRVTLWNADAILLCDYGYRYLSLQGIK